MAQKISKVDHDELLKALNEALSEEWLAYYQYWVGRPGRQRADAHLHRGRVYGTRQRRI